MADVPAPVVPAPVVPAPRLALLGGGFSNDDDGLLDDWVLGHARTASRPKVCFVPTASGDAPGYIEKFFTAFRARDCRPFVLPLFQRPFGDDELRSFLLAQDVVYVGGGNTANMLATWRVHGVDRLLREAYGRGTLLCGISAGANCWAQSSLTDSFGPLAVLSDGLGLLPASVCPHYDSEPARRPAYRAAVAAGSLPAGWAVDDGVGVLFEDGAPTEAVTRTARSGLYRVERDGDGQATEQPLPCTPLAP